MILRRVIEHVKKQHWTAVFLDFVIVVMGVFIGLQVNNWNEARKNAALAQEYLQRLDADMASSIEATLKTKAFLTNSSGQLELVISSLSSCSLDDARKDDFANGLYQIGKLIPATFVSGTLDEMRSSGNLGLVKSLRIRDALNEVERELEHQNLVWPPAWGRAQFAYIDQRVVFKLKGPKGGLDKADWSELAVDFKSLCGDQILLAALSIMQRQVYMNIEWLDRDLANFRTAKSLLDAELGESAETDGARP
jgi:hypothetical protein